MKNKKIKCDIYTRVSTTMQVDGYSLDAQKFNKIGNPFTVREGKWIGAKLGFFNTRTAEILCCGTFPKNSSQASYKMLFAISIPVKLRLKGVSFRPDIRLKSALFFAW